MLNPFHVSFRRVGGIRFVRIGRLTMSFSVAREFRPLKGTAAHLRQCEADAAAYRAARVAAALASHHEAMQAHAAADTMPIINDAMLRPVPPMPAEWRDSIA